MPYNNLNGWEEWGKHILIELKEAKADRKLLNDKLTALELSISKEIVAIQTKSSVWGAVIAAIVAGGVSIAAAFIM